MDYYARLKLAEVTAFVAVTGGLLAVFFHLDVTKHPLASTVLKCFGLITSMCFAVMHESVQHSWFHFARRAATLEENLGFELWSTLHGAPRFPFKPGTLAMRLFYVSVIGFWGTA